MNKTKLNIDIITTMLKDYNNLSLIDIANYINYHRNKFNKIDLSKFIIALCVYLSFKDSEYNAALFTGILNNIENYL